MRKCREKYMVDLCFGRSQSVDLGVKYEKMRQEYEETGLNQTILQMLRTFHRDLPISWEHLLDVLKWLFLNEMEVALLVFLYRKVSSRPYPDLYSLLLLCGLHAKMYLNNNVQPIKKVLEKTIPGFKEAFREFRNRYCGLDVPPMDLNSIFLELRRGSHPEATKIIDQNLQVELLDPMPDRSKITLKEADEQFGDSPCFLGYQYLALDLMARTKTVQADSGMIEEAFAKGNKEPARTESTQIVEPETVVNPLILVRQASTTSQISEDLDLVRERSFFSDALNYCP